MASFNKFNSLVEALAEKVHNLGSDTLKILLTNTAPVAGNSVKSDLTEISAGNGYTAGGNQAAQSGSAQSAGTYKLTLAALGFVPPYFKLIIKNESGAALASSGNSASYSYKTGNAA